MDKIAVVTGASRGIGAATARRLASDGYSVCVNYHAEAEAAARVVANIEASAGRAIAVQADVSRPEDVRAMFERVDGELGITTVLVNNAGIHGPRCRVDGLAPRDLERVLGVNVVGAVLCAQEAVRRMSVRHGGSGGAIVNVSSGSAYIGAPGSGVHYAISKGAVNSLTIGLSQEVAGEGIRVNAVSPGLTDTDMPERTALERGATTIPMGRVGEASEIAEAIAWLLSDKASYIAGANVRVGGGRP